VVSAEDPYGLNLGSLDGQRFMVVSLFASPPPPKRGEAGPHILKLNIKHKQLAAVVSVTASYAEGVRFKSHGADRIP
jgi:hypothetical protein